MRLVCVLLFVTVGCFAADPEPAMTAKEYKPLLGQARLDHYVHQTFLNPGIYGAALGSAIGGQIRNDPPEWGQGVQGYSTRAASNFGAFFIQTTVHESTAAALHLDPRYIRSGQTGFGRRLGHAIGWTFVTYDDKRHVRPNIPIIAGAYGGGMISTLWYPARYDPLKDGVRWGSQQMGFSVGINIFKEFKPELMRLIKH